MNRSPRTHLFVALLASITMVACDSGSSSSDSGLDLSLSGVEPLTNGFHYEGWLIIDGQPVTTGKFNVNAKRYSEEQLQYMKDTIGDQLYFFGYSNHPEEENPHAAFNFEEHSEANLKQWNGYR